MASLVVDGNEVACREGEVLLGVLRRSGIDPPTLCFHEAVKAAGVCRVCLVGIVVPDRPDKTRYLQSCIWKVKDGAIIDTVGDVTGSGAFFGMVTP